MKKTLTAVLLFLSSSAQVYADQAINNLVDISGLIAGKVQNARHAVAGAHHLAAQGTIVGVDTVTPHNITMEEMAAYNDALQGVRDAVYYNTQMFFEDKHEEAMDNLGDAVDMFTVAAQQLVVVEAVSEVAQEADTVDEQLQLQEFIAESDVELTQQDVVAFNDSLEAIETHAQEAAVFLSAANDDFVTNHTDEVAQEFNSTAMNMQVSFNAVDDILKLEWASNQYVSYHGFFGHDYAEMATVLGIGQQIYEEQDLGY